VLAIALIALISTVIAITLFLAGLEKTDATQASLLSTVEPVVTVLLAAVFLHEAVTLSQLAGGALILAAVVVISREREPAELTLTE
jgi:drug/metabolite transporter (DMT)-like permease